MAVCSAEGLTQYLQSRGTSYNPNPSYNRPLARVNRQQQIPYVQSPYVQSPYVQSPYVTSPQANYYRTAPSYVPIVSQKSIRDDTGYSYSYETADRTSVNERGLLKQGPEGDVIVADGSFSYVGPDGNQYTVTYRADENGFQPEGAHLPRPVESTFA
ncbi:Cuticle protein [Nesidiocoris tenuis]|nr:Cuticle protein [Nesidiocoris tenuis]